MTYEELKRKYGTKIHKQHHDDAEHRIQCACVEWFRLEHRSLASLIFAIPNGGARDSITGKRLKDEGVLAGVADLFLAIPSGSYHGLWIELKTVKGRQSPHQKEFEKNVKAQRYQYVIVRCLTEFIKEISKYLRNDG